MIGFFRWCYAQAPLLLCLTTLGWAGNAIAGKLSVNEISPMVVVWMRWTIVVLLLVSIRRHKLLDDFTILKSRKLWLCCMGGLGLTGFNALFYLAAQYTSAIHLGLIQSIMPALIIFGVAFIFRVPLSLIEMTGCSLTILGVIIIITKGDLLSLLGADIGKGDLFMLCACLLYAGYTIGLRIRPELDGMGMMTWLAIIAWICSFPLLAIEYGYGAIQFPSGSAWLTILFIAIVPSFLSQLFYMRAVDLTSPNIAGIYTNMVPIYVSVLAVLVLGEQFTASHAISLILVGTGLWLATIIAPKYKQKGRIK